MKKLFGLRKRRQQEDSTTRVFESCLARGEIMIGLRRQTTADMLMSLHQLTQKVKQENSTDFLQRDTFYVSNDKDHKVRDQVIILAQCNEPAEFVRILNKSMETVAKEYIADPKATYLKIAIATKFASVFYLKDQLSYFDDDDFENSKKARFAYLYKIVYEVLMDRNYISIKTDHDYDHVKRELYKWSKKVSPAIRNKLARREFIENGNELWIVDRIMKGL